MDKVTVTIPARVLKSQIDKLAFAGSCPIATYVKELFCGLEVKVAYSDLTVGDKARTYKFANEVHEEMFRQRNEYLQLEPRNRHKYQFTPITFTMVSETAQPATPASTSDARLQQTA